MGQTTFAVFLAMAICAGVLSVLIGTGVIPASDLEEFWDVENVVMMVP